MPRAKKPEPVVVEKIVEVEKIVYKNPLTLENIAMVKQWIYTVGPMILAAYFWALPLIESRAQEYVRQQFIAVGMDPLTLEKLGQGLEALKDKVEEGDKAQEKIEQDVGEIKSNISKVLTIIERQSPIYVPPVVQQAAPPPMPIEPTQPGNESQ